MNRKSLVGLRRASLTVAAAAVNVLSASWDTAPGYRSLPLDPTPSLSSTVSRSAGFTPVSAATSGIRFGNPLPVRLMMENNNLMNGSGVAAGDFDGDGWCDLFFAALDGTNALYRNLGNWRFEDVTARAGVGLPGQRSTGSAFADLDGDGDLDLLVATLGRGVHAFENLGEGHFREITAEAGLAGDTGSTTLALGDVDGDGDLDLYVANYGALSILRSGGRAEVRQVGGQWTVSGPYAKRLRFIEGRLEEVGEPDVLYLNDGQGRFRAVPWNSEFFLDEQGNPRSEPWDFGLTAQFRDLNGDRAPDLYVCNDFQTVDRVWINDGHGRFRALPRLAMRKQGFSAMGVDFGDLDRDGFLDFMVTEMMSRDPRLRLRQVVGMPPLIPEPGRLENRPEVARNTLYRNRGDTTFVELAHYSRVIASDWSWQPLFLDVDLDGFEDILIGNGMAFDVQDRDVLAYVQSLGRQAPEQSRTNLALYPPFVTANLAWRNLGGFQFEDVSRTWGFDNVRISQGLAEADFDHDGDLDLAINGINSGALLLRNDATAPRLAVRLRGRAPNPQGIGAVVRVQGGAVPLQMQEILAGGHYLSCSDTMRVFAAGSMTNDLTIEVRWRRGATSTIVHARPNRLYEIEEPVEVIAAGMPVGGRSLPPSPPAAADPTARRQPRPTEDRGADGGGGGGDTIRFREFTDWPGHAHVETFFADYARQPLLPRQLSQLGPGVAWYDLDGDGREELIVGPAKGGTFGVFRWRGTNRLEAVASASPTPMPDDTTALVGWTAADGSRTWLAGLSHYESAGPLPSALLQGRLGAASAFDLRLTPGAPGTTNMTGPLAVADVDGDGDLDLFVGGRCVPGAYPQPASSRLFRQAPDGLHLDEAVSRLLHDVGLVSGAVWSDLEGDGFPELVLACEWGPLRVFQNHQGQFSPWEPVVLAGATPPPDPRLVAFPGPSRLGEWTGWWNGITTGDLDGDGRLDLVASNWGLNTPWNATAAHPLHFYYGDLAGTGVTDVIEAGYEPALDVELPLRGLNALGQAFPMLRVRYPTHRAFSATSIPELLAQLPNRAMSVSAVTLASTAFLNRGTNWLAVPLPVEAQLAPAFAVTVADFDADGCEDLFLSQNFFGLRPEVPRLDGGRGLCLRGDGSGRFTPVPGQESGLLVYGEQRGAAVADFDADGRTDLVVTQNGAATRLFRNSSPRGGLRVRLAGPVGNPAGIGAVVRVGSTQGWGPAREIHGGSGYWSQDAPTQVMAGPEPVSRVAVRWPGGARTESAVSPDAAEIVVKPDGSVETRPRRTSAGP